MIKPPRTVRPNSYFRSPKSILLLCFFGLLRPVVADDDLPDAPGKQVVMKVCTACHGIDVATNSRFDKAGWRGIVNQMVSQGATATKDEVDTIVDYLATYFGPPLKTKQ